VAQKNIRVYFYELNVLDVAHGFDPSAYIWGIFTNPANFTNGVSVLQATSPTTAKPCEFRNVNVVGNVVKGTLALLRDDAPNVRQLDGNETTIPLQQGETLLEKNYFLYFKDTRLLVWHFNLAANHVGNLTLLLTALGANAKIVSYEYKVKDVFAMTPDTDIEYVELKLSTPNKKYEKEEVANLDPTDWGIDPFKIMSNSGARQLSITLTNRREEGLLGGISRMARDLAGVEVTKTLRVKVDGATEPIDLLSERFTYKETVEFVGHYPDPVRVFEALQAAKDKYDGDQND